MSNRSDEIRQFLLQEIDGGHSSSVVHAASERFGISRQAVNRHLRQLVEAGLAEGSGNTKQRQYTLKVLAKGDFKFPLSPNLKEDIVWRENVRPLLGDVPNNVLRICQYGFTEILNNAIDHSQGKSVKVLVCRSAAKISFWIDDDGVGIFAKIKEALELDDERHAILELSKGKLTTAPAQHTGEGIFFTSRAVDLFSIRSGRLLFMGGQVKDWLVEDTKITLGTSVALEISLFTARTLQEIFDQYTVAQDGYGFSKTHLAVTLARYGDENLVSRSQAKRLLARLDRFKEIVFDFSNVSTIGQAFADEIFRVFQQEHPETSLKWINVTPEVTQMIQRARTTH
jgi:DNA-binding transcriptional ArsR family regulator